MIKVAIILVGLIQPVEDVPTIVVTPTPTLAGMRRDAGTFMDEYFRHLSGPDVLNQFQHDYAAYIAYYGKAVDRDVVLQEKARFVRRWPQRSYRPRPGSIGISCVDGEDKLCQVSGLVEFECRSPERHAVSTGVARFDATVWFGEHGPQIIGEASEVIG